MELSLWRGECTTKSMAKKCWRNGCQRRTERFADGNPLAWREKGSKPHRGGDVYFPFLVELAWRESSGRWCVWKEQGLAGSIWTLTNHLRLMNWINIFFNPREIISLWFFRSFIFWRAARQSHQPGGLNCFACAFGTSSQLYIYMYII